MMRHIAHRIFGIVLVLALALGPVANGARAASMGAKMLMMASSDVHAPGKCDDCDAAKGSMNGACSATFCSGLNVFPPAGGVVFQPLLIHSLPTYDPRVLAGRPVVPDPYPPRPTAQS
jgi:hypothetical protein